MTRGFPISWTKTAVCVLGSDIMLIELGYYALILSTTFS
jgi:hypothetical protein